MIDPITAFIAIAVASFTLSYAAAKKAQREAKKAADAFKGVLVNKESNIDPIPVIYGERRVGGTRVFVQAEGGKKNKYLYIAFVLCEGEVDDIYDIKIDDYDLTDERYGGIRTITGNQRTVYRTNSNDLIYIEAYKGRDDQAASSILQGSSKWSSNHRLRGVAYLAIRLRWDEDVFTGMPDITAVVRGKKVRDVRTNAVAWSDNPANCLFDYLKNKRYGKGLADSLIDLPAFRAAADYCDQYRVRTNSGDFSSERIFRCNMVVDTGDRLFENVQKMLLGMRGFLPYTNGRYSLVIDRATQPVMTLTTNEILGGIQIAGESKKDRFNRVLVKFPNPQAEWQPDEAAWPPANSAEAATFLDEDGGEVLVDEIDMEMITSYYAARDFARIFCLRSRNALRCTLSATSEALNLVPSDVVRINHPTPGWTGSLKLFQVEEMSINYDGTVDLQLIEYDPSLYSYQLSDPEPEIPDTDLPDPSDIDPPTNLSIEETTSLAADGTLLIALKVDWEGSDSIFVQSYEIGWIPSAGSVVFTPTLGYTAGVTPQTSYRIENLEETNYVIGVRAVSTIGAKSEWAYIQYLPQGDFTAPGPPTNAVVNDGFGQLQVSWVNDPAPDLKYVEILSRSPDQSNQATNFVAGTSFTLGGLRPAEQRDFFLRSVDFSGNRSRYVYAGRGTTDFVDSDSFSDSVTELFENAGLYAPEPYNTLSDAPLLSADEVGKLIYVIDVGKLYEWTPRGWQPVAPNLDDAIGQIDGTNIGPNSISADKVTANFIGAYTALFGEIKAESLRVDEIVAGLAAFNGIITRSAQIEDAVVENANIRNLAVSAFKIGDNAVTIPEFELVNNFTAGSSPDIPNKSSRPYPNNELHPANWLTTQVLEIDWGAAEDEAERDENGYNALIPPARIAALANTTFFAGNSNNGHTCEARIIAVEGTNRQMRQRTNSNGGAYWTWDIPDYLLISNTSQLPASPIGLGQFDGYYVTSNQSTYVWNGSFVKNTSWRNGEIVHVVDTFAGGPLGGGGGPGSGTSYFAKWNDNANRFVNGQGIFNIGRGIISGPAKLTAQVVASGFIDVGERILVSSSLKFAVLQQVSFNSGTRDAQFTSLLLQGTKK